MDLLNRSQAANIIHEHNEPGELIDDYFVDDLGDVCGDEMSSDEEEEASEEDGGGEPVGVELKDDDDAPLVQAEPGTGRTDCLTEDGQCVNYPTLAEEMRWWRCKIEVWDL